MPSKIGKVGGRIVRRSRAGASTPAGPFTPDLCQRPNVLSQRTPSVFSVKHILLVVLLCVVAGGAGLSAGYTYRPQPDDREAWQRGFRFGYEAGVHDATKAPQPPKR